MSSVKQPPDIYDKVARVMSNWPIRTPMSKELRKILQALFSPEEAEILLTFSGPYVDQLTSLQVAKKKKKTVEEIQPLLDSMVRRQRLFSIERDGKRTYSLFPMIPGLFEFYFANHERAIAEEPATTETFVKEFEKYYTKGFVAEMGSSTAPMMRVLVDQKIIDDTIQRGKGKTANVDVNQQVSVSQDILPFEQVKLLLEKSRSVSVMDCACRTHMKIHNGGVPVNNYPINVCMMFNTWADYSVQQKFGKSLTKEEALTTLQNAAKAGLVHTTQNFTDKLTFICNCDRDCCVLLRGLTQFRNPNAFAKSNFLPEYDKSKCIFCERCVELCPMRVVRHHFGHAVDKSDESVQINKEACIGCGVCAFNCKGGALTMVKSFTTVPAKDLLQAGQSFVEGRLH